MTQKFSYETIRISDGKVSTADSAVPLWRLAGSGSSCMYVDDTFAAHILYPDTQQTDLSLTSAPHRRCARPRRT